MIDVPDVYRAHLATITGPQPARVRDHWEPDGILEFPYSGSVGTPGRLDGIDAIGDYFGGDSPFADWSFGELHAWKIQDADEYLVETRGSATLLATGAAYEQDYIVRFGLSARGRLQWMREFWDPTRA